MNRGLTNAIRFVMDELIPPIIRDSRAFMWLFFRVAYGPSSARRMMDFKREVYSFSDEQYGEFYAGLRSSVSRNRETDLNGPSIEWLLRQIPGDVVDVLDVGCGNGYLLKKISSHKPRARLHGCDAADEAPGAGPFSYRKGLLPHLPYEDAQFDVVCCTHVLEHIIDLEAAVKEVLRVTKHKLLIVVPCQRYYYFTLDEHVNFFHRIEPLLYHFKGLRCSVEKLRGDWALAVTK